MTRINAEFLCDHIVTFRPHTADEAVAIQHALFELGPVWSTGVPEVRHIKEILRDGLTVAQGQIFCGIDERDAPFAVCASAGDLGVVTEQKTTLSAIASALPSKGPQR